MLPSIEVPLVESSSLPLNPTRLNLDPCKAELNSRSLPFPPVVLLSLCRRYSQIQVKRQSNLHIMASIRSIPSFPFTVQLDSPEAVLHLYYNGLNERSLRERRRERKESRAHSGNPFFQSAKVYNNTDYEDDSDARHYIQQHYFCSRLSWYESCSQF